MSHSKNAFQAYRVGDRDQRPWGHYVVTATGRNDRGEESCEKLITVESGRVLSLQSHRFRRERWTVQEGTLTVVLDDKSLTLQAGQSIEIPLGAVHCMANLSSAPCIVHEIQEGLCREDDIIRYVDAYGRGNETGSNAEAGIGLYAGIVEQIGRRAA